MTETLELRRDRDRQKLAGKAFLWGNHLLAKIWRTRKQREENGLGSFLGGGATRAKAWVVKRVGKLVGWKGGQYGMQAESPGHSGKGQQESWQGPGHAAEPHGQAVT